MASKIDTIIAQGKINQRKSQARYKLALKQQTIDLKESFKPLKKERLNELKDFILNKGFSLVEVNNMLKENRSYINKMLLANYENPNFISLDRLFLMIK
jgi:hypothetical protein